MSYFRAKITDCSKYNVQLCEPHKLIVDKYIAIYKKENKRAIPIHEAVRNIVSEYGKLTDFKIPEK